MADFGSPVADQGLITPQQVMGTISGMIGLQKQRADIRTAKAQAQMTEQDAAQRAGIAGYFKNMNTADYMTPDGTWDVDKVFNDKELRNVAGDKFPDVVQQVLNARQGQLQNKKALADLNQDVVGQFNTQLGALRTDKDVIADNEAGRNKVEEAINRFAATGSDASRIANIYAPMVEHAPKGKLVDGISVAQLQAMPAGGQAAAQSPSYMTAGTVAKQTNPQAAGGDLSGGTNTKGDIDLNVGTAANKTEQAKTDQNIYAADLENAKAAPQEKAILDSLSQLSKSTFTGPGSDYLAKAESIFGQAIPGMSKVADEAGKRQMMGKYFQQLAMQYAGQNYGTDQGKAMVAHALPNPDNMTPSAIRQAANFVQTQMEIAQAKGSFAQRFSQEHNGSSVGYQSASADFMKNIDPRIFEYRSLPADERGAWVQRNFGHDKKALAEFAKKNQALEDMGGFDYEKPQ